MIIYLTQIITFMRLGVINFIPMSHSHIFLISYANISPIIILKIYLQLSQ